ncbi:MULTISPECIES: hypothetical protein [Mycolicibacterium]|uniref:hypothetical protein n=1 Tax=Mycolicibacterium TaxID=1866885 RepID=UPI0007EC626A|nr:hypothetical protein [Mycolicibacterium fortuitum]MCA4727035.1 hypothetical protein [Mycolicibacterium fortuitum]OBK07642.1 hypothetical protein A5637_04785 [Mycolicibacterium fortuitum]
MPLTHLCAPQRCMCGRAGAATCRYYGISRNVFRRYARGGSPLQVSEPMASLTVVVADVLTETRNARSSVDDRTV